MSRKSILIVVPLVWAVPSAAQTARPAPRKSRSPAPAARKSPRPATLTPSRNPAPLRAQEPDPDVDAADISFTGSFTARELRYNVAPDTRVEFTGQPKRRTVWKTDRKNLPEKPQPGVTYRNVEVRVKITSQFEEPEKAPPGAEPAGKEPPDKPAPDSGKGAPR